MFPVSIKLIPFLMIVIVVNLVYNFFRIFPRGAFWFFYPTGQEVIWNYSFLRPPAQVWYTLGMVFQKTMFSTSKIFILKNVGMGSVPMKFRALQIVVAVSEPIYPLKEFFFLIYYLEKGLISHSKSLRLEKAHPSWSHVPKNNLYHTRAPLLHPLIK